MRRWVALALAALTLAPVVSVTDAPEYVGRHRAIVAAFATPGDAARWRLEVRVTV